MLPKIVRSSENLVTDLRAELICAWRSSGWLTSYDRVDGYRDTGTNCHYSRVYFALDIVHGVELEGG